MNQSSSHSENSDQGDQAELLLITDLNKMRIFQSPPPVEEKSIKREQVKSIEPNSSCIEELRAAVEKHIFINKWYRGPNMERQHDSVYRSGERVIIIDDDEDDENGPLIKPEELLQTLLTQNVKPTTYLMGDQQDKQKILDKMKQDYDKERKARKELEAKKIIKNSDVKMTIYPAYDNFFKKNF